MASIYFHIAVYLLLILQGSQSFQWMSGLPNGSIRYVCKGHDLLLPWNFTLFQGEQILDIQWYFRGLSEEMIAMFNLHGVFIPTPAFANRVQFVPFAGIILKNVVPSDAGNYTVEIVSHSFANQRGTVTVLVTEPPTADHDRLVVIQERSAVYNNETDEWSVQMTCGHFSSLGHPAVDVVWRIPSGETARSTAYKGGKFCLTLPNPVKGGNYTCSLVSGSPAAQCLSGSSGLLQTAEVNVDEVGARLTLIEARQNALNVENSRLEFKNHQLEQTDANLTSYIHQLQQVDANLTSNIHQLEQTDANLTNYIHSLEQNITQMIHTKPDPCAAGNHIVLNDAWRDSGVANNGNADRCDHGLAIGWYRFQINGRNAVIPNSCVAKYHCGTDISVWLDLEGKSMPELGQEVEGRAYGSWTSGCKQFQANSVTVRNCGSFYVFRLHNLLSSMCFATFCASLQH